MNFKFSDIPDTDTFVLNNISKGTILEIFVFLKKQSRPGITLSSNSFTYKSFSYHNQLLQAYKLKMFESEIKAVSNMTSLASLPIWDTLWNIIQSD